MSFAHEVKKELTRSTDNDRTRLLSECYGMLLFSRKFSCSEIGLKTESICVAERYIDLLSTFFSPVIEKQSTLKASKNFINLHSVSVVLPEECNKIYSYFGHSDKSTSLRLNRANIEDDMCRSAFLRGAFLSCGYINDPEKNYHLEFCAQYKNLCNDLCTLLSEVEECRLSPKTVLRNGSYVVYFKDSEQIMDLLTYMGAPLSSMDIMNTKAYKEVRNMTNRRINSELANIAKTASAAAKQLAAIDKLDNTIGLSSLPEQLREIAYLRRDNPELSLRDLGELLSPPISRSGVNHRLMKLVALAELE